jgi:hypothetical protein
VKRSSDKIPPAYDFARNNHLRYSYSINNVRDADAKELTRLLERPARSQLTALGTRNQLLKAAFGWVRPDMIAGVECCCATRRSVPLPAATVTAHALFSPGHDRHVTKLACHTLTLSRAPVDFTAYDNPYSDASAHAHQQKVFRRAVITDVAPLPLQLINGHGSGVILDGDNNSAMIVHGGTT